MIAAVVFIMSGDEQHHFMGLEVDGVAEGHVGGPMVGWGLTALSTQFRSYRDLKVVLYVEITVKYYNLIGINLE